MSLFALASGGDPSEEMLTLARVQTLRTLQASAFWLYNGAAGTLKGDGLNTRSSEFQSTTPSSVGKY